MVGRLLSCCLAAALCAVVPGRVGAGASHQPNGSLWWSRVSTPGSVGSGSVPALAVSPDGRWLAQGDAGGVVLRPIDETAPLRRITGIRAVNDLRFARDGALWIATDSGLWWLDENGRLEERSPAPGEEPRRVARVASAGGIVVVGTAAGAHATADGRTWHRLRDGLRAGPVSAVALRAGRGGDVECWMAVGSALWRLVLQRDVDGVFIADAAEERVPGLAAGEAPLDLALDLPGVDVAVVLPRALSWRASAREAWQTVRPVLPPGAIARTLSAARGRWWLATDRGLVWSRGPAGPWRRAGSPAGTVAAYEIATAADRVFVATEEGLLEGAPSPFPSHAAPPPAAPRPTIPPARQPPIGAVQRAALRHQGLEARSTHRLRASLARRAWLPVFDFRFDWDQQTDRRREIDEAFISSATRRLIDRDRDRRRGLEASVSLTWDLRDLVYDPEVIDLSREARLVIALRDDVLDEIHQLYFERRAVLESLAGSRGAHPEAPALERRAAELAAGLDGWTGGWFSAQLARTHDPTPQKETP